MLKDNVLEDLDPWLCYAFCRDSEIPIYTSVLCSYHGKSIVTMTHEDAVMYKLSHDELYTYSQFVELMTIICKHYPVNASKNGVYELILLLRDWE